MKKILVTGATGSIGKKLCGKLIDRENEITVFSRDILSAKKKLTGVKEIVQWDYNKPEEWTEHLNGKDAVIQLAGINLSSKRWNKKFKRLAYESRIISTRNLVEAIKNVGQKPKVFICSSGIGLYGDRYDEILSENSLPGNDYMANLCKDWEMEASNVESYGVRRVSLRTSPVLIKNEGVLKKILPAFKLYIGGPLSTGKQWFPWIHIDDIIGIYLEVIENENLSGPVNAASPGTVRMRQFAKILGKVLNRPSAFPVPKFIMKIAAGEVAEYAVMSQRTSVDKILNAGYKFKFENLEDALMDLLK